MFEQTFSLIDVPRLFTLIFLECILSLDNALALALIVRHLPAEKRKKALFIGVSSATVLRAIGVLSAAFLIQLFWIQILGGFYLLYLAGSHLFFKSKTHPDKLRKRSFWKTVLAIEFTDFVFALDSILAGIAMIGIVFHPPNLPPKIWIVYFGGIAGIFLMRFAAQYLTKLLERFRGLEIGAHLIVGWIGVKLLLEATIKTLLGRAYVGLPLWADASFWLGIVIFFCLGFVVKGKKS